MKIDKFLAPVEYVSKWERASFGEHALFSFPHPSRSNKGEKSETESLPGHLGLVRMFNYIPMSASISIASRKSRTSKKPPVESTDSEEQREQATLKGETGTVGQRLQEKETDGSSSVRSIAMSVEHKTEVKKSTLPGYN